MSEISSYVGAQVRRYRKACGMTIQQLADQIHKSRATVCKYENGEIVLDVETLYEISQVLQISFSQLTAFHGKTQKPEMESWSGKDHFLKRNGCIFIFMMGVISG